MYHLYSRPIQNERHLYEFIHAVMQHSMIKLDNKKITERNLYSILTSHDLLEAFADDLLECPPLLYDDHFMDWLSSHIEPSSSDQIRCSLLPSDIFNSTLSWAAKGILVFLMCNEMYTFEVQDIPLISPDDKTNIINCLNELLAEGMIEPHSSEARKLILSSNIYA